MRFRKLRIAWSVGWGIACALLIALWLRSYFRLDGISGSTSDGFGFQVYSTGGRIVCSKGSPAGATGDSSWQLSLGSVPPPDETEAGNFWFQGFGLLREPCASGIWIPHWFPLLLSVAIAAAPWLRWHFSLHALLIATMLVAVVLGLAVWVLEK